MSRRSLAGETSGSLLATYDMRLYDEAGEVRKGGGALRDLLGVELTGEPLHALPERYYRSPGRSNRGICAQGRIQIIVD
jgi:hypothetical protein